VSVAATAVSLIIVMTVVAFGVVALDSAFAGVDPTSDVFSDADAVMTVIETAASPIVIVAVGATITAFAAAVFLNSSPGGAGR